MDTPSIGTVDNDEEISAVNPDEETDETEDEEVTDEAEITEELNEADTAGISEVEGAEGDDIDNNWASTVVILTGCGESRDELNTRLSQLLYYKTL